jgi:MFS transporter, DHA1 family, multidrug resistance protein
MKGSLIQFTLYISEFLTSLSFTIIASFYPAVAESKGIPLWLIGIIFSIDPLVGLPTSLLVGKFMNKIGRKAVLIFGMSLGSIGMFTLSLVEISDLEYAIFFSFLSRILAGVGSGCSMTAAPAILVSEYPENVEYVIGCFEAASGLGFLTGPLLGSLLSLGGIFVSFSMTSLFYAAYTITCYYILSDIKKPKGPENKISFLRLIFKPVSFI